MLVIDMVKIIIRYKLTESGIICGKFQLSNKFKLDIWKDLDIRFTKDANGIIYDAKTKLEWLVHPDDKDINFYEAEKWVNSRGGNWRMPTIEELSRLYQKGVGTRNIDPRFKFTGWWVWSGELATGYVAPCARYFNFYHGNDNCLDRGYDYGARVFSVRCG